MVFLREFALDSKEVVAFTLLNTYVSIHPLIRIIKSRKLYIREGGIFTFNFLRNEKSNFFLLLLFYRATMKVLSEISLVFDTTRNFSSFHNLPSDQNFHRYYFLQLKRLKIWKQKLETSV